VKPSDFSRKCFAFPNDHYSPAGTAQDPLDTLVPGGVSFQLPNPILPTRRGNAAASTTVHVPEAAVDEDDFAKPEENQVRAAWERGIVKAVVVSQRMYKATDNHLGPVTFDFTPGMMRHRTSLLRA
jgi:hypothetical protein